MLDARRSPVATGFPRVAAPAGAGRRTGPAPGPAGLAAFADEPLQLDNIQTDLRFQTNDTWSLDHFQADFAGAKLTLSGDIGHAPELRNWEMFRGSGSANLPSWQAQLQKFSDTLDQIHFTGTPQLTLTVNGDARDLHSFLVRLKVGMPAVQTPWFGARDIQLMANLTAPASAPANFNAAWGFWTNLQPYQIEWTVHATQLESAKLNAAAVGAGGFWRAPELAVTNLSVELGGGRLDANARLNVATRELAFTNSSCFDVHALDALLPEKTRKWLAEISWTQPPSLQIGGALVLPAWTNHTARLARRSAADHAAGRPAGGHECHRARREPLTRRKRILPAPISFWICPIWPSSRPKRGWK